MGCWLSFSSWDPEKLSRDHDCVFSPVYSPLVVSLSRIMKDPTRFPGASSCLSASFLLTPLKNQLNNRKQVSQNRKHFLTALVLLTVVCSLWLCEFKWCQTLKSFTSKCFTFEFEHLLLCFQSIFSYIIARDKAFLTWADWHGFPPLAWSEVQKKKTLLKTQIQQNFEEVCVNQL